MTEIDDNEEAYLEVPQEQIRKVAMPDTPWAQISDDGKLELLRWDIVQMYAMEFDMLKRSKREPSHTHTICKLLVLVREQVRNERYH